VSAERVPYDPGLPTTWRDVETATDPFDLADGLAHLVAGIRQFFNESPGGKGWIVALYDDERRQIVLSQLAFGGAFLARISTLIDETLEQHERDRESFAQMTAEVTEEIRQRGDAGGGVRAVVARVPEPADVGPEGARA
jgi:hypothetical protein